MNRRFPLYVDLTGKKVLVYGGGNVALRRCRTLSQFGPSIVVVAPEILPEFQELPGVVCVNGVFSETDMPPADFLLAATGDPAVNHAAVTAGRSRGILVNDASDPDGCDFHFPAIAIEGPLVVGINAGGADHGLVARTAAAIRKFLSQR